MDGTGNKFLAGPALPGDQNAARLRSDGLDHVKDGAHVGALPDNIVETGKPPKFAAEIAGFFPPFQVFGYFMNGAPQLVHELVIFDDVAVGAGVDGGDGGLNGRNTGNQQKKRVRSNLFAKFEELHTSGSGHADIGDNDVEDLRVELALGGFHAVCHFDTVTFLAKSDFQELEDGFFVIDNENMWHLARG